MFAMLLCAEHIIPIAGEPIDDGAVLVRDGRIVEVGGAQRMKAHYPQEEVRDFGRSAIMPGFVDCHTHLEYTALRGIMPRPTSCRMTIATIPRSSAAWR